MKTVINLFTATVIELDNNGNIVSLVTPYSDDCDYYRPIDKLNKL